MKIIPRAAQRSEAGTRLEETPMRGVQPLIHTRAYWPQSQGAPLLTQFDMSARENDKTLPGPQTTHFPVYSEHTNPRGAEK